MKQRSIWAGVAGVAIVLSGCTWGSTPSPSSPAASQAASAAAPSASTAAEPSASAPAASIGEGEGELNLIAWAGYVVGGTGGEQVPGSDWVTPFETATGCKVTVKVGLGEHGPAHEDGPVRRSVGVG